MTRSVLILAVCLGLVQPSMGAAQPSSSNVPANPLQAGRELAAELRALAPAETTAVRGTLKVRERDGQTAEVPVRCQIIAGDSAWKAIYEVTGTNGAIVERLTVVHRADGPNQYLLERRADTEDYLSSARALKHSEIALPVGGSDFWLLDLGLDFFHWPEQRVLKTEMRKGRSCRVLESRPDPAWDLPYGRVLSWVDLETGGVILAEAFDRAGKPLKEFSVRSLKKVDGHWQLQEMEIRDLQQRSRTRLEFEFGDEPKSP